MHSAGGAAALAEAGAQTAGQPPAAHAAAQTAAPQVGAPCPHTRFVTFTLPIRPQHVSCLLACLQNRSASVSGKLCGLPGSLLTRGFGMQAISTVTSTGVSPSHGISTQTAAAIGATALGAEAQPPPSEPGRLTSDVVTPADHQQVSCFQTLPGSASAFAFWSHDCPAGARITLC